MPLISVIIPVYNVESYLRQCLDSIINQTLKDIEIICIDDGSTDNSLHILEEYKAKDNRIFILKQQNQYAGVARNNGLKIAKGKYLSFLDSDDWFELNMLEEMYKQAEKDQSDIVICDWFNYNNTTKQITPHSANLNKLVFSPIEVKDTLFTISYPNPWTKLFKRQLFIDNNLHFEDLKRCNDLTCVYTAFAVANKISIVQKPFIYYRSGQTANLTAARSKSPDCFIEAINRLYINLKTKNKYSLYKDTFTKRTINSLKKELSAHNDKTEFCRLLKTSLNKDLYNDLLNELNEIFKIVDNCIPNSTRPKNNYF